jgi:tripartite-type tricarboxylate transporter receptor subunit TctC
MKSSLKALSAVLFGLLVCGLSTAQTFPSKTVTLMVPYPAGGVSDVIARSLNNSLSKQLGQPVIVENLGGASGGIAAQKVLNSPAEGHIIFQGSPNELILAPMSLAAIKYKPEDFRLVQMITVNPLVMLARKDLPVSNGDELVAYARKVAGEGKPLTFASVGPGSLYHLLGEHMSKVTGIEMTHVPYKGGAPALQAIAGGEVQLIFEGLVTLLPQIKAGRLRALAITGTARDAALPDVPTVAEAGLAAFQVNFWSGLVAPAGTPADVVTGLNAALRKSLASADARDTLTKFGLVPSTNSPAEFARFIETEIARWEKAILASGAKVD